MIARVWRGRVPLEKADEYEEFLRIRAVPDYHSIEGNRGVTILRRDLGEYSEFLVVSYWDSLESIKEFAGEDYERAKYYPEDKDYLIEFEPYVTHYRVSYKD